MLLSSDIQPKFDVYYQGAKLIDYLDKIKGKKIDFFTAFEEFNSSDKISMNLFILTLDWLYILGLVRNVKNGQIEKCF